MSTWRRRLLVFALGGAIALGAAAATPVPQELDALGGIRIGQPFPAADEIPDCPLFEPFRRENLPDELCVDSQEAFSAESIALKHVPLGTVSGPGRVVLRDGRVHGIRVTFDRRDYAAVRTLLIERHGAAQARTADESGEALSWSGPRVAMSLREDAGDGSHATVELREREGLTPSAVPAR